MAQKAEITIWEQSGGWVLYSTQPIGPKYAGYGISYLSLWLETPFPSERSPKPLLVWKLPEPVRFRKGSRWLHWKYGSVEYWGWLKEPQVERLVLETVSGDLAPALERKLRFSPRWLLLRELERGKMNLQWVALSLLRPRIRIEPGKAGFRVQFFLKEGPWPEGIRPLDLALERFPELWLLLI